MLANAQGRVVWAGGAAETTYARDARVSDGEFVESAMLQLEMLDGVSELFQNGRYVRRLQKPTQRTVVGDRSEMLQSQSRLNVDEFLRDVVQRPDVVGRLFVVGVASEVVAVQINVLLKVADHTLDPFAVYR